MSPTTVAERPAEAPAPPRPSTAPAPPAAPPPSPKPSAPPAQLAPSPPPGSFVQRHPVLAYYVLAFAISWGGILLVITLGRSAVPATPEQFERLIPFAIPTLLLGPSIAGLLMTGLADGRAGYREMLTRLLTWRVGAGWYAVALLTAPVVFLIVPLTLSLASPAFAPGILTRGASPAVLLLGIGPSLLVGFLEELGWTGFAIPRLLRRNGVLATGLGVGVLWGAWHILTNDLWGAGISAGDIPVALFVAVNGLGFLVGQLPAYRVLMVWLYDRTDSLLLAMLMHASLTASTFLLGPSITGVAGLVYGLGVAVAMWILAAAVVVTTRGQLSRRPLPPRPA